MADSVFDPPRSRKQGCFNIITLMEFIDKVIIGSYNKIMTADGMPDKVIDMRPFNSQELAKMTGESAESQGRVKRIITYRINSVRPALLTRGVKELRPRLRETFENATTNELGAPMTTDVYGRFKDYRIRFDCFCQTWKQTQELLLDFDELMMYSTKFIEGMGANKFIQEDSSGDSYRYDTLYFYETMYFMARLEKLQLITGEAMRRFEVTVNQEIMQTVR